MIGLRKDNPEGLLPEPGDYGMGPDGLWYGMTPNGHLANLSSHVVMPWEDGTITVVPSLLVSGANKEQLWHGFLTEGVWESTDQIK